MTSVFRNPSACCGGGGGDAREVLIEDDIEGVELVDASVTGEDDEPLDLHGRKRRKLNVKYFRAAVDGDPGFTEGELTLILATKDAQDDPECVPDPGATPPVTCPTHTDYDTMEVVYDAREAFSVGTWGRNDYKDEYDEDDWPPLVDDVPIDADLFKKKYTGYVRPDATGNWLLAPIFCEPEPKPDLEDLGYVPPEE